MAQGGFGLTACGALGALYFSAEGDEDILNASATEPLSWRGDAKITHSDWKIIIATNGEDSRTYNVHKNTLSNGPRSSKYFANLFLEQEQKHNQSHTTRIELDDQDAESFPLLLDFIYNSERQEEATDDDSLNLVIGDDFSTSNAVSLRHLARVFECEGLMLAVNKFIQRDLSLKTGPSYLLQANLYQDERLVESAKRLCVENFTHLESRAVTRLPLSLFRSIISSVIDRSKSKVNVADQDKIALSHQLSEVVCQYFERHPKALNVNILLELTNKNIMPDIASEAAIGFTALARELNSTDITPDSDEWKGLIKLCKRCSKVVVAEYGWKDFNITSALEEYLFGVCAQENDGKIDSLLFATSFAAALEKAQKDYKLTNTGSSETKQHIFELEKENSDLHRANRDVKGELERYKHILADTKEELLLLKQQVKNLRKRR